MPIKYRFRVDDCPSFGGASLSEPREQVLVEILDYIESKGSQIIESTDIQSAINHNENDTRSIITILKKFNFTNLTNREISADMFFTKKGHAFALLIKAKRHSNGIEKKHIVRACQLILQDAIWEFSQTGVDTSLGINTILNIIGTTKRLSLDEYCFALSELKEGKNYEQIAKSINENKSSSISYNFTKDKRRNGSIITARVAGSILQSSREILQQAGILKPNLDYCEIIDYEYLNKHNISYYD